MKYDFPSISLYSANFRRLLASGIFSTSKISVFLFSTIDEMKDESFGASVLNEDKNEKKSFSFSHGVFSPSRE